MTHLSGSLHLEGTVLHTVSVLHAEFHQEMLEERAWKEPLGGYSTWVVSIQEPWTLLSQAGRDTSGTETSTVFSARHHLRAGNKHRAADALSKFCPKAPVDPRSKCSRQSFLWFMETLCSFFPTQMHRTARHFHLWTKTHWIIREPM